MKNNLIEEVVRQIGSLLLILVLAVITDLYSYKIPNEIIITGILSGTYFMFMQEGAAGILHGIVAVGFFVFILFPLFLCKGLGAGDIKLCGVIGGFLGIHNGIKCLTMTFLIGALFALIKLLNGHNLLKRIKYFLSYFYQFIITGKLVTYERDIKSGNGIIHFSIPSLLSTLLFMEGVY